MKQKSFLFGFIITLLLVLTLGISLSSAVYARAKDLSHNEVFINHPPGSLFTFLKQEIEVTNPSILESGDLSDKELFISGTKSFSGMNSFIFKSKVIVPVNVTVPAFPQLNTATKIEITGSGEVDVGSGDYYSLSDVIIEGDIQTTEHYRINNEVFLRKGSSSKFTKYSKKQSSEYNSHGEDLAGIISQLNQSCKYQLTKGKIDKNVVNIYDIALPSKVINKFSSSFVDEFETLSGGFNAKNLKTGKVTLKLWIDISSQKVLKARLDISKISFNVEEEGILMNISLNSISFVTNYSDWGDGILIKSPVNT